jgi:hypothetical protein
MNPWSFYEHQPQLFQAGIVAVGTWTFVRGKRAVSGPARIAAVTALGWAGVGVADYLVYAFGYQLARLTAQDVEPIQNAFEWLRVVLVIVGVLALRAAVAPAEARSG